jgi:hypothetical protein
MNARDIVLAAGGALNRILFGARVSSDPDVISQWATIATSYVLNLLITFVFVAAIFALAGYSDPAHSMWTKSALRMPVALSNLIAFVLTSLASLNWKVSDEAIERQRAASRSRIEYVVLVLAFSIASLLFLAVLFLVFDLAALVAGAVVNSALLQLLLSERHLKTRNQE